jgi:tRNA modification GTPase
MLKTEDTIAAISTPVGEGGIGIVRLSGPQALTLADSFFASKSNIKPSGQRAYTAQYGFVEDTYGDRQKVDEVLCLVMRAPRSYTREDMVEISCHGGRFVIQKILELCIKSGARLAQPGEFTKRAFMNGRIDLVQAESVLDLIRAKTDRAYAVARAGLEGSTSQFVRRVRDDMAKILSHLEASIDFPDDRLEPMSRQPMVTQLMSLIKEADKLIQASRSGLVLKTGLKTVLLGKPNVGKSSLMNVLTRSPRVITSHEPGTTRDTVEEEIQLGGCLIRLVDTAGIQNSENPIEIECVKRTRTAMQEADLVLFVVDGSKPLASEEEKIWKDLPPAARFLIINKMDCAAKTYVPSYTALNPNGKTLHTSCLEGSGIEALEKAFASFVLKEAPEISDEKWLTSVRHVNLFLKAKGHMVSALKALEEGGSPEFPAQDVRFGIEALGQIVGEVVTDDILDLVFGEFCIGK